MRLVSLVALGLLMAGCASVVRPFTSLKPDFKVLPADAMREVARDVERAVQDGNRAPEIAGREGIVTTSDEVKQAIRTRAARLRPRTGRLIGPRRGTWVL